MVQLFPIIIDAFEAKKEWFTNNNLPAIAFIDMYMGQPVNPDEFEFTLPAIFIDYSIDWAQELIQVDAHVLTEFAEDSGSVFTNKSKGLDYLRTLAISKRVITNLKTDFISRLKPLSERPVTTEYYHYHMLSFGATIQDYVNTDLIPSSLTDATGVTAVIDKHSIKRKTPNANGFVDL